MTINENVIRWIRIAIEGAFLLVFVILAITVGVKNKKIRELKEEMKTEYSIVDSLQARCERYGQMEGISVSTTFVINNKNIMSVNTNAVSNVTRNYAVMTKEEVLKAIDSLNNINKNQ